MTTPEPEKPIKRPRLRLPFEGRKQDAGSWTYDHRVGLCVTLIAYLTLMIIFVSANIAIGSKPHTQGMLIDFETLATLEEERDRLEAEVQAKQQLRQQQEDEMNWRSIQNLVSNENAQSSGTNGAASLNERLGDDRGTNAGEINVAAAAAGDRMRANREAYEMGLAEERAIREQRGGDKSSNKGHDVKVKGHVTVSFSLANRTSRYLNIPAYKCEGGGDVEVEITVNPAGDVINAKIAKGGDDCMRESALSAARRSQFNIDNSAPARQQGTITYIFIPQ